MRLQCRRPVTVRGKTIGGPLPLICLPLIAPNREDLDPQARELIALSPDILEWRIDGFEAVDSVEAGLEALAELREAVGATPLIFTCRIDREGGLASISRKTRLELITAALGSGQVDVVDTELCNDAAFIQEVLAAAKESGVKVILSFHDFEKTPEETFLVERLVQAQRLGAHIAKTAVMPRTYADVLVLLGATLKARTEGLEIPLVSMAMGAQGVVTRLAGGLFGSDITFAMGRTSSAPGQIPIAELRQAMALLYRR
ncbi:MAG: type I 3-dehydroquinate dehydratase [Desulfobacterales bacterium]